MIGLAIFGLMVLVVPAVIVLGVLAVIGLLVVTLSGADAARAAGGVRVALLSPRPTPG